MLHHVLLFSSKLTVSETDSVQKLLVNSLSCGAISWSRSLDVFEKKSLFIYSFFKFTQRWCKQNASFLLFVVQVSNFKKSFAFRRVQYRKKNILWVIGKLTQQTHAIWSVFLLCSVFDLSRVPDQQHKFDSELFLLITRVSLFLCNHFNFHQSDY